MLPDCKYGPLRLSALNHVSRVCKDIQTSVDFYESVLDFVPIQRPSSFEFDGAWLFNLGLGVGFHLIQSSEHGQAAPQRINPLSDHLSFQSECLADATLKLTRMGIPFIEGCVVEAGIRVNQVFFHDPDANMIEICNCDCLPIRPLGARPVSASACPASLPQKTHLHSSHHSLSSAAPLIDMERSLAKGEWAENHDSSVHFGIFRSVHSPEDAFEEHCAMYQQRFVANED